MRAAHLKDLPQAFGRAMLFCQQELDISRECLATACQMREEEIEEIERGLREPTLAQFVKLALGFGLSPGCLFNLAVARWPDDPDAEHFRSALHVPRLYRLAWYEPRRGRYLREEPEAFESLEEAVGASVVLNAERERRKLPKLIMVGMYLRLGTVFSGRSILDWSALTDT